VDISCYLITNGEFKNVLIPQKLLNELITSLRNKGIETVQFVDRSIEVEGIYVPAKGTKNVLMVMPSIEE
jgi:hypothetical protein